MFVGEIVAIGDVAMHDDGNQHIAVILSVTEQECEAVFFTSNPVWAENSRRATREELALAGFVKSRPTYLAYVKRPTWDFHPLGRTFPTHRVATLLEEFRPVEKIAQRSL